MLACFTQAFVQDNDSVKRLSGIGINSVVVSGDTRYDRVSAIAALFEPLPAIEKFIDGRPVLVAGSTWPEDEEELDHFANTHQELRFIIAPHEIGAAHLREIEQLFNNTVRYSAWVQGNPDGHPAIQPNTLIIDNIGMLSKLYHYATLAYIGGGFGHDGLHNILEAAVYGVPVVHGPVYEKFPEAVALLDEGGSFAVDNALMLEEICSELLLQGETYKAAAIAAAEFVRNRKGATEMIIHYIQANRLLTK